MSETKYTTDGKKVLIVGKLNNTETIVQEIFIATNGQEIPSGENFVVKSLHDAPVVSWKEKKLQELEATYEKESESWDEKIRTQRKRCDDIVQKAKLKADALFRFFDNKSNHDQLETLKSFMVGEITHFFISEYDPKIVTWEDEMYCEDYHSRVVENIRLVSLYGKSNGDLEYKICEYWDGSGSKKGVIPCKSYGEALEHAQKEFNKKAAKFLSENKSLKLERWMKIEGLVIPENVIIKHNQIKEESKNKRIADLEAQIQKLKGE